ncbi:MAG: hypothetical protein FWE06_06975 [Oscillospiraceae bacterium]|nr:hypothetical protein [Oscillospiraceae bacterium]
MSERVKPKIEEEFNTNLSGDLLTNALAFVEHMDEISGWNHLGEAICFFVTEPSTLRIFFGQNSSVCTSDFNSYPISDEMKNFVFNNLNQCNHFRTNGEVCGCGSQPGQSFIILGEKFDNICHCPIMFVNPTADTFEEIKKLVEAWKLCIAELKSTR